MTIRYHITPADPVGHLFDLSIEIDQPTPSGQIFSLPNWIPGSYLIRDFSKHIVQLQAFCNDRPIQLTPLNKSKWQAPPCEGTLELRYQIYAWDLSVRGAHFDQQHAFFNGTSVFMQFEGHEDTACQLSLHTTEFANQNQWRVATGMPEISVNDSGFGDYLAQDYKELIEYPFEVGRFHQLDFSAKGIPHKLVLTGKIEWQQIDQAQLKTDLVKICEYELDLFGKPYPINQYVFMVMVTENSYGGLEHLNSTALMCARDDLPYKNDSKRTAGYLQFLELCAHEYFHTWNVKRIQPEVYQASDLLTPAYSEQLWWFEGVTSYYDALILYRAGIINVETYLDLLAKQMTRVYRMPGRFKQSVAESSYLTWTKFYQQDENAPNAIISYYTKGSLIALALDLMIRQKSDLSLDTILLYLWNTFGRPRIGLVENQIETLCSEVTKQDLSPLFQSALHGKEDIDFNALFQHFGIEFSLRAATQLNDLGGKSEAETVLSIGANLKNTQHNSVTVSHVFENQSAYMAGLSAGDEIIAINEVRVRNTDALAKRLLRMQPEESVTCYYFRRDELYQTELTLLPPMADRVVLTVSNKDLVNKWLETQVNEAL